MRIALTATCFTLAATLAAGTARATDPRDVATAEALFRSAREAASHGDLASACAQFGESMRLDPAVGTLLNLADCEEKTGHIASALTHFQRGRSMLPAGDFRVAFADERIGALSKRVARLGVRWRGPVIEGASVARDGTPLTTPDATPVDPGAHAFVVHIPGRADARTDVTVREGETKMVELGPGPESPAPAAAPATPVATGYASSAGKADAPLDLRPIGYIAGGVGVVGLALGVGAGVAAIGAATQYKDHCDPAGRCDPKGMDAAATGRTMSAISPFGFVLAAVGLGVGGYILFKSPAGPAKAPVGVGLLPDGSIVGSF